VVAEGSPKSFRKGGLCLSLKDIQHDVEREGRQRKETFYDRVCYMNYGGQNWTRADEPYGGFLSKIKIIRDRVIDYMQRGEGCHGRAGPPII